MASESFNAVGGITVGIPAVAVVDANGNIVTNVLTSGNVAASYIYSDNFRYSNGQPFTTGASGLNTQLQYNNSGSLGGIPNVTWNGSLLSLGNVSALSIGGGLNGYFLQTDGNGVLSWAAGGGGGGNGTPGGANTQVQFNDAGTFGGDAGFTYNKNTNVLFVATGNIANINANVANITGNISANYFLGNGSLLTGISANVANTVSDNAQPNITSLGILTSLDLSGPITSTSNISISGNITAGNINLSRNVSASSAIFTSNVSVGSNLTINSAGNLRLLGNLNAGTSANVYLGTLSNIHIDGGVNGYVLTTDGTGNLTWSAGGGGGGNGTPGGSNTQIQYNDSGSFGGSPFLTFNEVTNTFNIAGNLIANSFEIGSGVYRFSKTNVFFATTSTTSNVSVISIDANNVASIDFTVIATDPIAGNRQVSKLSAVMYQSTVDYNEYSTLNVNGPVGNFTIGYTAGNIINPSLVTLYVEPVAINLATYKIQMTLYQE